MVKIYHNSDIFLKHLKSVVDNDALQAYVTNIRIYRTLQSIRITPKKSGPYSCVVYANDKVWQVEVLAVVRTLNYRTETVRVQSLFMSGVRTEEKLLENMSPTLEEENISDRFGCRLVS